VFHRNVFKRGKPYSKKGHRGINSTQRGIKRADKDSGPGLGGKETVVVTPTRILKEFDGTGVAKQKEGQLNVHTTKSSGRGTGRGGKTREQKIKGCLVRKSARWSPH